MKPCVVTTDGGTAYVKCLGNPQGPHALACEWIATSIARVMGLPTFDFALLDLDEEDVPFPDGRERPGPAFATREEEGATWSGDAETLALLSNPDDIAKLVVFDTLVCNWDRCPPNGEKLNYGNLFLSTERVGPTRPTLLAMDHSHAISSVRRMDLYLEQEDRSADERIYGLFQAFAPYITEGPVTRALRSLSEVTEERIDAILAEIPPEWILDAQGKAAVRTFLLRRRAYLVETLYERLSLAAGSQRRVEGEEEIE